MKTNNRQRTQYKKDENATGKYNWKKHIKKLHKPEPTPEMVIADFNKWFDTLTEAMMEVEDSIDFTVEDVKYNLNFISRLVAHKYAIKAKK